jgi:hypothetical protein
MTIRSSLIITAAMLGFSSFSAYAEDFPRLDKAVPANGIITSKANQPAIDYDSDSCLPSAGISRDGDKNGGLSASGSITGGCRTSNFNMSSNTLHRYACTDSGGDEFCAHFFALYFEKDQATWFGGGHRHDWEYVALWTKNGDKTHASYSAHGDLYTEEVAGLDKTDNGRIKFVYHKDGVLTHAMRFASSGEVAENPYGDFFAPVVISWYELAGDSLANAEMRSLLNSYDYGSASIPLKDSKFLSNINEFLPSGYPTFTTADVEASQVD